MKLTDDIVRALHGCIEDGFEGIADFANRANVSANTISKYMRKETTTISKDSWEKILPFIKSYMPRSSKGSKHGIELDADQKILLDAFGELPSDIRNQKLLEIVELAKKQVALRQEQQSKQ